MIESEYHRLVYLTCTVLVFISPVHMAPVPDQYSRGVDWLSRYGYLPPPDPRTGQLQTKDGIERAVKEMQRFAGLKDTGKLDKDTLKLMATPRCSLPDIIGMEDMKKRRRKRRYATTGLRWKKSDLSWSIQNYPSLPPQLQPADVNTIMAYALNVWSDVTNLKFHEISSSEQDRAEIKISFARSLHDDGYPFDGKGGTLAHAFFPGESDVAGDTHFDDEESWTYTDDSGTDLFSVAVHEFGHALGLSHSSTNPSIMRPYYQGAVGDIATYTLPEDDRYAIQSLYGRKRSTPTPSYPKHPTSHLPKPPNIPHPRVTLKPDPSVQDRCEGSFDAVANIRGDVFFFKGPYFWRIQRSGSLVSFHPALIKNFWIGLPDGTDKIDAVYERRADSRIIFFIGSQYWVFKDTVALPGYPRPLSDWGLISHDGREVKRVEAAFIWAHNGKTYLFSGGLFWRFTESQETEKRRPDKDYPRNSSLWKGVPTNPDDIITWEQGDAYFFKNNSYWVLKSGGLDQDSVSHRSTAVDWMMCPELTPTKLPGNQHPRGGECSCGINRALQQSASSGLLSITLLLYPAVLMCLQ
ncbi:matrix metalloproteinase-25 [Myxocyprinus asiaticus]|uniref:matrix metalloproteinase-25 n=1 Tax=Myxocyprinus asiaticus TaxID=70543 RepID=UPI002221940E|nr:matrix metalloproteinase-25 [Myxocyprinus asiaticus]XP_051523061.1 matrix metalloproteinase-25 [Myxocyprinus asiaticus]